MKVAYIQLPDGNKLISYHRHDYKHVEIDEKLYMIDGGQEDYIRSSGDVKFAEIDELIETIRNEYEVKCIKLKDQPIDKIKECIKFVKAFNKLVTTDSNVTSKFYLAILNAELKYRKNNNII